MRPVRTLLALAALTLPTFAQAPPTQIDRDLLETDIPHLQALYAAHRYTVTQVTQWYLARIARYNGIYRDIANPR